MLPEYVLKILNKIAHELGFTNYKFESKSGSNIGDNFSGILLSITLSGTRNETVETIHLMCKMPPTNENRRKTFKSDLLFERELYMYNTLLPQFAEFQREKGLSEAESFLSYPKVYHCEIDKQTATYLLIMEDLRPKNYKMWPKHKTIQLDHQRLAMKEFGKLHAISFAMKDQKPDQFAPFKLLNDKLCELGTTDELKPIFEKFIETARDAMIDPKHKKILQNLRDNWERELTSWFSAESTEPFGVIGHGDSWNNNFMYRYGDETVSLIINFKYLK